MSLVFFHLPLINDTTLEDDDTVSCAVVFVFDPSYIDLMFANTTDFNALSFLD